MEKDNQYWILDIEDMVASGLRRTIPDYFKTSTGVDSYLDVIEEVLQYKVHITEEQHLDRLDVQSWLKLIVYGWQRGLREHFDYKHRELRNWAGELLGVRNQLSHRNKIYRFTEEDTHRAAQTARLLLETMGAVEEANSVKEIENQLKAKIYEKEFGSEEREKRERIEKEKKKLDDELRDAKYRFKEISAEIGGLQPHLPKFQILLEILLNLQQNTYTVDDDGELVHANYIDSAIMNYLRMLKQRDESYALPTEFGELAAKYEREHARYLEDERKHYELSLEYHGNAGIEASLEHPQSFGSLESETSPVDVERARVIRVNNGVSIDVELNAEKHRVRYIGINALEGCRDANARLVEGRTVSLIRDVSDADRYGRLLRYVYVDDIFVNEALLRDGYASASPWYPDTRFQKRFRELEEQSQNPHDDGFPF